MGTFKVTIEIGDPQGLRWEKLEALVDTGATYAVVPGSMLRRLSLVPTEHRPFRLADERIITREIGTAHVRIGGRTLPTVVVFGEEGQALLGAVTLEEFGLATDPVGKRLVSVPGLLMALAASPF